MIQLDKGILFSNKKKNELSSHEKHRGTLNANCRRKETNLKGYRLHGPKYGSGNSGDRKNMDVS